MSEQNNNNNQNLPNRPPRMPGRGPRFGRGMLIYLAILIVLVYFASGSLLGGRSREEKQPYSEIVALFDDNRIESYQLDLGSGELTYRIRGESADKSYTVPNVSLFYDAVQTKVDAYNAEAAEADRVQYDLLPIKDYSTILSIVPTLILVLLIKDNQRICVNHFPRSH